MFSNRKDIESIERSHFMNGGRIVFPFMSDTYSNLYTLAFCQPSRRHRPYPCEAIGGQYAGQQRGMLPWGNPYSAYTCFKCLLYDEEALVTPWYTRTLPDGKVPHAIVRAELGSSE